MSKSQSETPSSAPELASDDVDCSASHDDLPVLDAPTLRDSLSRRDSGFSADFVRHFQEMTRYRLTAASRAAEDGNWTAVASTIGEMGIEAESLGLRRWQAQCRKIEALCAEGRTEAAGSLIGGLQEYCLEGVDALRAFVQAWSEKGRRGK